MQQKDLEDGSQRFLVELPRGRILRPARGADDVYRARVDMRTTHVQLHPGLPPTPLWSYEHAVPGPRIEVPAGRRVEITWVNELTGTLPFLGVRGNDDEQRRAGSADTRPDPQTESLPPWAVVHLHGGHTGPDSDGWTENVLAPGQQHTSAYRNELATLLWYHDHAVGATRLNVFAGLAGLYVTRNDVDELLPGGPRELFLLLADRNLDTDDHGELNGRLLHKTGDLDGGPMEFFGPFTSVNGVLWPRCSVRRAQHRVRIINASNARTYRLTLVDDQGRSCMSRVTVIGTDGGLLPIDPSASPEDRAKMGPVALADDEAITLAPAERIDLIVDFRDASGPLRFVNDAGAPWDGTTRVRLTHHGGRADAADAEEAAKLRAVAADVVQFVPRRVAHDDFDLRDVVESGLWPTYTRYAHDKEPFSHHMHRLVGLVEDGATGILTMNELYTQDGSAMLGGRDYLLRKPYLTLAERDENDRLQDPVTWATAASAFMDAVTFSVAANGYELWKIVNLTEDTHPLHLHLVQFQVLDRVGIHYDGPWEPTNNQDPSGADNQLVTVDDKGTRYLERTEWGWKDTVRVNPNEIVTIMARFDGHAGRYLYHCHVLEHEDMDMMRPYVVVPAELATRMRSMSVDDGMSAGQAPPSP